MSSVQVPEAAAPRVPAVRDVPRPPGHTDQGEADAGVKSGAPVKIAVDAMGGDHAPDEIVRGALLYREKGGASDLVLVGREDAIRKIVGEAIPPGITIRD